MLLAARIHVVFGALINADRARPQNLLKTEIGEQAHSEVKSDYRFTWNARVLTVEARNLEHGRPLAPTPRSLHPCSIFLFPRKKTDGNQVFAPHVELS